MGDAKKGNKNKGDKHQNLIHSNELKDISYYGCIMDAWQHFC